MFLYCLQYIFQKQNKFLLFSQVLGLCPNKRLLVCRQKSVLATLRDIVFFCIFTRWIEVTIDTFIPFSFSNFCISFKTFRMLFNKKTFLFYQPNKKEKQIVIIFPNNLIIINAQMNLFLQFYHFFCMIINSIFY